LEEKDVARLEKFADALTDVSQIAQALLSSVRGFRAPLPSVREVRGILKEHKTSRPEKVPAGNNGEIGKCERAILNALAQYPQGRSSVQVAILTGYSSNSGGFNNSLGKLRSANFITRSHPIRITDDGKSALGDWDPLPTGQELLRYWYGKLPKCERAVLETLAGAYPESLTNEEIAEATGYSSGSGGFNNALSRLRTLELIQRGHPIRISEDFYQ